ncbi:MAG: hypothetical protein AAB089_04435 [Nitrospirota bacterium]
MFKKKLFVKGQSLAEIIAIFAIVSLVVVGMQIYVKRGIQGKTKALTDKIIGLQQKAYTAEDEENISWSSSLGITSVETLEGGRVSKNITEDTSSTSYTKSKQKY